MRVGDASRQRRVLGAKKLRHVTTQAQPPRRAIQEALWRTAHLARSGSQQRMLGDFIITKQFLDGGIWKYDYRFYSAVIYYDERSAIVCKTLDNSENDLNRSLRKVKFVRFIVAGIIWKTKKCPTSC